MTTVKDVVFDSVHTVANYLYEKKPDISPLKLQKSLYFLYAYYGAYYAKQAEDGVFEGSVKLPKYLFNAEFEAWKYGPVIRDVYSYNKSNFYSLSHLRAPSVLEVNENLEVKKFIDELFEQIDSVSDFALVDRSHEDNVWKEAFKTDSIMDNDEIIKEYIERYVNA
jgi:uncharacterized phage-associated protein